MYVHSGIINEEIGFHTIGNSKSLSALGSIFFLKDFFFLRNHVRWYGSRILGRTRWVNIYIPILGFMHGLINEEVDFHTKI